MAEQVALLGGKSMSRRMIVVKTIAVGQLVSNNRSRQGGGSTLHDSAIFCHGRLGVAVEEVRHYLHCGSSLYLAMLNNTSKHLNVVESISVT